MPVQKCKLLVADTSEAIRESLRELLEDSFDLRTCRDGRTALELLHRFRPDILVLDLMLPGIDGLSLLQTAADAGIRPAVIATTRQNSDYILDAVYQMGASYIMLRPCEIIALADRIRDLACHCCHQEMTMDLTAQVRRILVRLGFSISSKNYPVLEDAVLWYAEHPGAFLSKELYPAVSKPHGISSGAAEKRIREYIHKIWKERDDRIWQLYFPPDAKGNIPCPSSGVFLARIADQLPTQLEQHAGRNV